MSVYAERKSIMDKIFVPPVSIEKFAAYLDGNLSVDEMNHIDALASTYPEMEELIDISDEVDENIQIYMQDEFVYEADLTTLEDSDFDIPNLDADIAPYTGDNGIENRDVACTADERTDVDEIGYLNGDDETMEVVFENDEFQAHQDEDSISVFNDNNGDNGLEPSHYPLGEEF